jgi:DNA adenine methylase
LAIAKVIQKKNFRYPWIVSYDNAEEICAMYHMSQALSYGLNYTAQRRYVGNEVMFFKQNLIVPDDVIPQSKIAA